MEFVYTPQPAGQVATSGNTDSLKFVPESTYVALVVDVIFDHLHPNYSEKDGYNVGSARVRIFNLDNSVDTKQLSWAHPMELNGQQFPLVGELVVCHKILGDFFYSKPIPLAKRIQENGMLYLNKELTIRSSETIQTLISKTPELNNTQHRYGRYFKPDKRVRPLKQFEGDYIIQGRMGHSIRLGSSQMDPSTQGLAPNIILRTGQAPSVEQNYATKPGVFGLTIEDINKDASSIWMTSDQAIPFIPATKDAGSYVRSIANAPQIFDGASIVVNSNRVILNAKKSNILLFSNEGIHLNSYGDTTIDTDNTIKLTANLDIEFKASRNVNFYLDEDFTVKAVSDISMVSSEKLSLISKKIHIGSVDDEDEPMVGGTTLAKFLARLILALTNGPVNNPPDSFTEALNSNVHVITSTGPGRLAPGVIAALKTLYSELAATNPGQNKGKTFAGAPFNSEANFVALQNEEVELEKNAYQQGKQIPAETSRWVLSESYYNIA